MGIMRCKLVSLQKSNINRICARVRGIRGTIYLLPYVNWISLLMNMSEKRYFTTTLCKSPKLNFNKICKGVYKIQWTPCYTAFMGNGVCHQHGSASCMRKTLKKPNLKSKQCIFPVVLVWKSSFVAQGMDEWNVLVICCKTITNSASFYCRNINGEGR
jgi:hypothetical protein